jgi:hypothetical protein
LTDLLTHIESEHFRTLLNGQSEGVAYERKLTQAGDFYGGEVIERREAPHPQKKGTTYAVLTVRIAEGQAGGEALEAGLRVVVRCNTAGLTKMVERFDPQVGDEIAILLHEQSKSKAPLPYSYNVVKPAQVAKEEEGWS